MKKVLKASAVIVCATGLAVTAYAAANMISSSAQAWKDVLSTTAEVIDSVPNFTKYGLNNISVDMPGHKLNRLTFTFDKPVPKNILSKKFTNGIVDVVNARGKDKCKLGKKDGNSIVVIDCVKNSKSRKQTSYKVSMSNNGTVIDLRKFD